MLKGVAFLGIQDGFVPVFPDGFVSFTLEKICDLGWAAFVVDSELLGGLLAGFGLFNFYASPLDCEVEVIVAPSFTFLPAAAGLLAKTGLVFAGPKGSKS